MINFKRDNVMLSKQSIDCIISALDSLFPGKRTGAGFSGRESTDKGLASFHRFNYTYQKGFIRRRTIAEINGETVNGDEGYMTSLQIIMTTHEYYAFLQKIKSTPKAYAVCAQTQSAVASTG